MARACFAHILFDTFSQIDSSKQKNFNRLVKKVTDELGGIPEDLNKGDAGGGIPGKRQPTLSEAITATVERYNDLDDIRTAMSKRGITAFYGGSLMYGPFYNVRNGRDASDVDMVIVTSGDSSEALGSLADSGVVEGGAVNVAMQRADIFADMYSSGEADLMSHKFPNIGETYDFSVHFMPPNTFKNIYDESLPSEEMGFYGSTVRTVKDYRSQPIKNGVVADYTSSRLDVTNAVVSDEADGGFISRIPYAAHYGGRFYVPGIYQDLFIPKPGIVSDSDSRYVQVMEGFIAAFHDRISREHAVDPMASVLNTKARMVIIPPEVPDEILGIINATNQERLI